jgi:peptide/nickel transport system permease protein
MGRHIAVRLVQIVITFFLFLTAVYFLMDAQPGDIGSLYLNNPKLTSEQRARIRVSLGLDKPPLERYLIWMKSFLKGDLGLSFSNYPRPVLDVIIERAPRTLALFLSATVVSFYFGFLMGKVLAWKRGSLVEYGATLGGVALYTVFTPWFGLMMIWLFAVILKIFPIGKFIDPVLWRKAPAGVQANDLFIQILITALIFSTLAFAWWLFSRRIRPFWRRQAQIAGIVLLLLAAVTYWLTTGLGLYVLDILHHLILPVLTLALISFAGTMLLTRNSMLETLREDYIMTARAKGLPEKVIRDHHAARNALLPVVTSLVFSLAFALSGGIITETVFSWPGMGLTLLDAAEREDIPLAIGALIFTGVLALVAHLVADILYAYLDPRIRYQ